MRTTIDLPDRLYKEVKATAALKGIKLKDLVTKALSEYVRRDCGVGNTHGVPEVTADRLAGLNDPEALAKVFPNGYRLVGPLIPAPATPGDRSSHADTDATLEAMMLEEDEERYERAR